MSDDARAKRGLLRRRPAFSRTTQRPSASSRSDAALLFLDLNGFPLLDPERVLFDGMIAIGDRRLRKEGFARLLRELADV
jgi:hypothetical protein